MIMIDEENKIVRSNQINHRTFAKTKRFSRGTEIYADYEADVFRSYNEGADFDESTMYDDDSSFYKRKEFDGSHYGSRRL